MLQGAVRFPASADSPLHSVSAVAQQSAVLSVPVRKCACRRPRHRISSSAQPSIPGMPALPQNSASSATPPLCATRHSPAPPAARPQNACTIPPIQKWRHERECGREKEVDMRRHALPTARHPAKSNPGAPEIVGIRHPDLAANEAFPAPKLYKDFGPGAKAGSPEASAAASHCCHGPCRFF